MYVTKNQRKNTVRLTVSKSALMDLPDENVGQNVKFKGSSSSDSSDRGAAIDSDNGEDKPLVFSQTSLDKEIERGVSQNFPPGAEPRYSEGAILGPPEPAKS